MSSVRVAFVDADPTGRDRASTRLAETGFEVRTAGGPEAGRDLLSSVDRLVVVDSLPEQGLALLRTARAERSSLPVLLFARDGDEALATAAFRAGAADYVRADGPDAWDRLADRLSASESADRGAAGERPLRTLVGDLPGVVYRVTPGGEVPFVDGDVAGLTGYPPEVFTGGDLPWRDLVVAADRPRLRSAVSAALEAREPFEVTYRIRPRDGEERWVTDRGRGVFEDDGLVSVEGVVTDVTDRRRRDRQVRELHAATRRLVTADTPDEIAAVTVEAAGDVLGYPVNGARLLDGAGESLVPAAIPDETRALMDDRPAYPVDGDSPTATAFRRGETILVESPDEWPDDRDRDGLSEALYLPMGDHGALSIGATGGSFDADDQRLAGLLADNAGAALSGAVRRAELATERDRLAALFENVPEPTVRVRFEDGEPCVAAVNPAFEELFGYDEATLRGESIDDYVVPPDDRDRAREFNRRVRAGQAFDGEVERLTVDGPREFHLQVVPRELEDGTTEGFGIYTDISERKARERELERQNERLDAFAGIVSHDLRNPLNVAEGRVELARETGDLDSLENAGRALERIRSRIESLLELAREGEVVDEPTPVPLAEAAHVAWAAVETGDATLDVRTDRVVMADGARLERLLENLFGNCIEHGAPDDGPERDGDVSARPTTDGGTGGLTVTVGAGDGGFSVADDGVGFSAPPGELFESGFSTAGGTGLGLSIVESIAEAHDWAVAATEREGGGARFEVTGVRFAD